MGNQELIYLQAEVAETSEAVGDAGLFLAQPVVVGDATVVDVRQELVVLAIHLKK